MSVFENNNYKIVTGKHPEKLNVDVYWVINVKTGVAEAFDECLPKALGTAQAWSDGIDRFHQKIKETSNVVPFGKPSENRTE